MLKKYFEKQTGMTYKYYFTTFGDITETQTLTSLTFRYKFPDDFKPALKEIWDKVNEVRLE